MLTKATLKDLVKSKLGDALFVVASNREPYIHVYKGGRIECQRPASGMAIALDSVMQACGGVWVAAGTGSADREVVDENSRIQVPEDRPRYTLRRLWLSKEEEDGYYYGLSNETMWPLCHIVYVRPKFDESDWLQYRRVNERFAKTILEEIGDQKAFVWFQDMHLSLAPKILKEKRPDITTAHFWHIPWPNTEIFRICPWRTKILEGLLANDIIGFHTRYHCNNFLDTIDQMLEAKTNRDVYTVSYRGSKTFVKPFPISVDFRRFSELSESAEVDAEMKSIKREHVLEGKIVGVGVERIDYTKGIPERLKAIDRFLEKYTEYQNRFVFLQLGAPSRTHIDTYKKLDEEIEALVEDINWKYKNGSWHPIVYWREHHGTERIIACYRLADVCIVSPLHDGMNLVAKEFVAAKNESDGSLVLSRFCGSARELTEATLINPYDTERFADSIKEALKMPAKERTMRMNKMRETVQERNIYEWAGKVISALTKI